jgi:hypothetical protein
MASVKPSAHNPRICFASKPVPSIRRCTASKSTGWLKAEWGVSEANQRAKYYRLTAAGKAQLVREQDRWSQLVTAIGRIMNPAPASGPGTKSNEWHPITTSWMTRSAAHIALSIKERIENGEDPKAARLAALKEFGNVTLTRDSIRAVWRPRWLESADAPAARHPHRDALADARQRPGPSRWP